MTTRLAGRYFDGRTAATVDITLLIDDAGVITSEPAMVPTGLTIHDVTVDSRISGLPASVRFPDGAQFQTRDHAALEQRLKYHGKRAGRLHTLESRWHYAVGSALLVFAFAGSAYVWGIPILSALAAPLVPESVERKLGDGALEQLDKLIFKPSSLPAARQQQLQAMFAELKSAAGLGDHVTMQNRSGGFIDANAFALPDGTVVMTDELVALATDDDQLRGVLLHELGHLVHHHSLRQVLNQSSVALITLLVAGDVSSAGALIVALPGILLQTAFSRDMEREADDYAVDLMHEMNIDTAAFTSFLERLDTYFRQCNPMSLGRNPWREDDHIDGEDDEEESALTPEERAAQVAACMAEQSTGRKSGKKNRNDGDGSGWLSYLATHPATAERIARLQSR